MMLRDLTSERNPYLVATITAVSYMLAYSLVKYALGREFSLAETLLGGVVFWGFFFLIQRWLAKRIKRKKK